ncbi:3'-5' exonuclease [Methylobacillus sp.]|uniref:3'-5' exonuclease n=1 Tax=Methylobacillus sp. TaxID=56818 RepID=UPI0012CE08F1|nr:3'-5' exonuclease [Methylobacillus sp.]MPS48502.1 3'-5' exonuclease [Methylobacillus sp.]
MIFAGIDLETTGLSQTDGHRIVEFGALLYQFKDGVVTYIGKLIERINPQRPIDPKAQAVHGISFEDVANCPIIDELAPKIARVLNKADVHIAHNGESFDMPFLHGEMLRLGIVLDRKPLVDTMVQGRWATPMGKYPNLGELCFACGVDYDPSKAHGAEYDIQVMMDSFFVGLKKGFFKVDV